MFEGGIHAVAGVDLEVADREIYAFLGPNGAGKTTTVRMLTTLLRPTGGSAQVAGFDVVDDPAGVRRAIGVALQEAALDPLMTGRELIRLQATLHGLRRQEGNLKAEALLERVDLVDAADRQVGTYSGGMRRRLDLASALVHEPRVLFLDEPTTGLDPVSRQTIWEEVENLNREGTTVFLTTQYLEEADQLANRVGIIDDGRIVAEDTPGRLKAQIGHPHLEIKLIDGSRRARPRRSWAASASRCRERTGPCSSSSKAGPPRSRRSSGRWTRPASASRRSTSSSRRSTTCSSRRPGITSSREEPETGEDE